MTITLTLLKWALLALVLALDVYLLEPWLAARWAPAVGVDRAFWSALIPIASALIGAMASKKKNAQPADFGGETGGGGFDWRAASPWLAGAAGLGAGALFGRQGGGPSRSGARSPLDDLLEMETARVAQNEPLRQALLAMSTSMLPTHMRQTPGVQSWEQGYRDRAQTATPRAAPRHDYEAETRRVPGLGSR